MAWTVEISDQAEKQIRKLDKPIAKRILDYFFERIEGCKNPRHFGEPLKGSLEEFWRYRIGDYRVLCEFKDNETIVVLAIGHRKEVYKRSLR